MLGGFPKEHVVSAVETQLLTVIREVLGQSSEITVGMLHLCRREVTGIQILSEMAHPAALSPMLALVPLLLFSCEVRWMCCDLYSWLLVLCSRHRRDHRLGRGSCCFVFLLCSFCRDGRAALVCVCDRKGEAVLLRCAQPALLMLSVQPVGPPPSAPTGDCSCNSSAARVELQTGC